MGIFNRQSTNGTGTFATWHDPVVSPATTDWQRRLDGFAKKSARTLTEQDVPLFSSAWARDGQGTYRDAFWLVAADVEGASRSWVKFQPGGNKPTGLHYPPPAKQGEYVGHLRGSALLLTRSGLLCAMNYQGFMTRGGGVDNRSMDMIFSDLRRDELTLSGADGWGWYNQGRWRRDPRSDLKVYGVDAHVASIRYEEKWRRNGPSPDPGYGTSAALSTFVKTKGETRWPRHFISFDY
jgi:hypothetical protein